MKLGFTGTRETINLFQMQSLRALVRELQPNEGHHGLCTGGDEAFHDICMELKVPIIGHPPKNTSRVMPRFKWEQCATLHEPLDYILRNRQIVLACAMLIATPLTELEITRSGTWTTVRLARRLGLRRYIITPTRQYIDGADNG